MYDRKDAFYQRAKDKGYRSRAAFKLIELARSERLFRSGDRVIDLGAWPGGWLQVAAELIGERGIIVGIDRRPIEGLKKPNARIIVGDVGEQEVARQVWEACGGSVNVVLSDLAPSLTGIKARDEAEGSRLLDITLSYVDTGLQPRGILLTKLFMSSEFSDCVKRLESKFETVRILKPQATRKGSAELYALARGYRGNLVSNNV